jgi:Flp pilus assembly protein CpaB
MNTTRLVTLVAATMITVAESLLFLWLLAPAPVEATAAASTPSDEVIPVIVVTAHRHP